MKLVIDIPQEEYNLIVKEGWYVKQWYVKHHGKLLYDAVRNGILLETRPTVIEAEGEIDE